MPNTLMFKPEVYRWLWLAFGAVLLVVGVIGYAAKGLAFFTDPLPVPIEVARYWLSLNGILFIGLAYLSVRNLLAYLAVWTAQERMVTRGMAVLAIGSVGGTLARSFGEDVYVSVTIGAPFSTAGLFMILYGLAQNPDRFAGVTSRKPVE